MGGAGGIGEREEDHTGYYPMDSHHDTLLMTIMQGAMHKLKVLPVILVTPPSEAAAPTIA